MKDLCKTHWIILVQVESSPDGKLVIAGFKVDVKKARSQEEMREAGGWKGGRGGGRGRGGYNRGWVLFPLVSRSLYHWLW